MMDLLGLDFVALLLTAILLGSMACFTAGLRPLVALKLPPDQARGLMRALTPWYQGAGAVLALAASACVAWSFAGLALALAGVAFLFALLWLAPTINRNRERGIGGDPVALATYKGLRRAGAALAGAQLLAVLVAFGLIATGLG